MIARGIRRGGCRSCMRDAVRRPYGSIPARSPRSCLHAVFPCRSVAFMSIPVALTSHLSIFLSIAFGDPLAMSSVHSPNIDFCKNRG